MTNHNEAKIEDIAPIVIMPGDPKRATLIADKYLENKKLVNDVRGMKAYTGYYNNKRITVMAHGMGMPSASIYVYELFKFYNVDVIIRIGSAGSYSSNYRLGDIVLLNSVTTKSNIAKSITKDNYDVIESFDDINNIIRNCSVKLGINIKDAKVTTMDVFEPYFKENLDTTNLEVTEMLTIADENYSDNNMDAIDREKNMDNMIKLALKSTEYL